MDKSNLPQMYPQGTSKIELTAADVASNESSVGIVSDKESDAFYFRSLEAVGIYLNKPQIEAVRHYQGPALVLAGAGSGKTRVLTSRAGYLIAFHHVNPKNILLVTFTKKASEEMKERIAMLPGLSKQMVYGITTGTFHSIFYRLLKSQGYNQHVLSSDKQKQIAVKMILKRRQLQDSYEPETLLAILSSYKNNMKTVQEMPSNQPVEKEIKDVLSEYEAWKNQKNYLDFDDMLLETYRLLQREGRLLSSMQQRFQYILCDEWQDTNPIQYELIKMIAKPNNHLFVVGDDDQCIFSFNGADSSIILNFAEVFPETNKITLDINYRSTADIVALGNQVIKYNNMRHVKTLKVRKAAEVKPAYFRPDTTEDEARILIDKIIADVESGKRTYGDFAILHRTVTSSRAIFDEMVLKEIPFVTFTRGETFYEHGIVKPVLNYLRLSIDPQNLRAIESILPSLYLNREKTMEYIETQEMIYPAKKLIDHLLHLPYLKDFQKKQIIERIKIMGKLHQMTPREAIKTIRGFYDKYLEANDRKTMTTDKEMIKETLAELSSSAKKFDTLREYINFIDEIIHKNDEMSKQRNKPDADVISLMTIHRSKGLEYPVIFVIGASETILPHSSALEADQRKDLLIPGDGKNKIACAIEEERRLAYVAITRAEVELLISSPSMYRGKQVGVSRFLIQAYGETKEKASHSKTNIGKPIKGKTSSERNSVFIDALVWDCTNSTCDGWKKTTSEDENTKEEQKVCPLCKCEMVKKDRKIKSYI